MGLLDNLTGDSLDDPRTTALMAGIQGLLGGRGTLRGISGGLLARNEAMSQIQQQQQAQQMQTLQMQQHQLALQQAQRQTQRQDAIEALPAQFMGRAVKPDAMDNRDVGQPGEQRVQQGPFDMAGYAQAMFKYDPKEALALQQYLRKDATPIKLGAGESLVDPTSFKPLATNPKDDAPSAVKEYNFAKAQGYAGTLQQFMLEQKKAGAPSVSVSMDKGFGTTFADNAAKDLGASRDKARSAVSTINTLNNIDRIIDGGNVATGPTQPFQTFGMQIAQGLGIGGKDNAEKLANTRQVIQSAANLSLDGAARMAGQGQITEGERALIKDAAGGGIDRMTPPEIKALTAALRKVNQGVVTNHKSLLTNVGPQFKQFTPFYNVDMPSDAGGGWSIKPKGQ